MISPHVGVLVQLAGQTRPDDWSAGLVAPSGAWFTEDKRYRTLLWRTFGHRRMAAPLVFGMLNPSTADALELDPTIRRCVGFAERELAGGVVVVNLSPYRATDPADLYAAHKRGEDVFLRDANEYAWHVACCLGRSVVLAWGAGVRAWMAPAVEMAVRVAGADAQCLGWTQESEPRHPLMLAGATRLERFVRAA
jgi:hypothetical protein